MRVSFAILLLTASLWAAPPAWKPASFRGLTLGHARREDAVRTLGSPDADRRTRNGEELVYKARGAHRGDLTVRLDRSGTVSEIQESFSVAIPRTKIYQEFGEDALTAHFSVAKCAEDRLGDPIGGAIYDALYRDPRGPIELTLYPSRGIVLWPDQYGYDFAAIHYLARPPGLARKPACATKALDSR